MGQPMTEVGQGKVDVHGAIRAATSTEWHIVELDHCATDMLEAVHQSYAYLTREGLSTGLKRQRQHADLPDRPADAWFRTNDQAESRESFHGEDLDATQEAQPRRQRRLTVVNLPR